LNHIVTNYYPESSPLRVVLPIFCDQGAEVDFLYDTDVNSLIFQVYSACFVLGIHQIEHNDLHPDNILAVMYDEPPIQALYAIGTKPATASAAEAGWSTEIAIVFPKKVEIFLLDWDLAHSAAAGNNPKLEDPWLCGKLHSCNRLLKKFPPKDRPRVCALKNILVVTAWMCYCKVPAGRREPYMDRIKNYLTGLVALPGKVEEVREFFSLTCLSGMPLTPTAGKEYFRAKRDEADDPLGMNNLIPIGEFFLDPKIYEYGYMFKDPLDILKELVPRLGGDEYRRPGDPSLVVFDQVDFDVGLRTEIDESTGRRFYYY
jgi:hypothetical protein